MELTGFEPGDGLLLDCFPNKATYLPKYETFNWRRIRFRLSPYLWNRGKKWDLTPWL